MNKKDIYLHTIQPADKSPKKYTCAIPCDFDSVLSIAAMTVAILNFADGHLSWDYLHKILIFVLPLVYAITVSLHCVAENNYGLCMFGQHGGRLRREKR